MGGAHLHHVAADAEGAVVGLDVVALVGGIHQQLQQLVPIALLALFWSRRGWLLQ